MRNILISPDGGESFLRSAQKHGYSMEKQLITSATGITISNELKREGYLEDYTELIPTYCLDENNMTIAAMLHNAINQKICLIEEDYKNHLPLFSVRVFEPGETGTTIHRNHPVIGPWAVGITLRGNAPFSVYDHEVLEEDSTLVTFGDDSDPEPRRTMNADAGSGWTLYTKNELIPHGSGIVESRVQRELIIFYANNNY